MPVSLTISSFSEEFLADMERFKVIFDILEKHKKSGESCLPSIEDIVQINHALAKSKLMQGKCIKSSTKV